MLIVDAHEDIAWNILTFGRDYTRPAVETRRLEYGTIIPEVKEDTLLGWADYQRGQVAVVFGTLFAAPQRHCAGAWETQCYRNVDEAHHLYRSQLDAYNRLADDYPDHFRLVQTGQNLQSILTDWLRPAPPGGEMLSHPVGIVVMMEGAEGVREPGELEEWWQWGVRLIGPAWVGTRFCGGTHEPGPMTKEGFALLEGMASLGFGLDLSHMDEAAALQALDAYPGPIVASHGNVKTLLKNTDTNRHLTDRVIQGLLERNGVVGVVPYNRFLKPDWRSGDPRQGVSLQLLTDHIDYICQMAGNARHVGLGSDFDGGFGLQSTPIEIDTVADLQKIATLLAEKGYNPEDIAAILGGNWLTHLQHILP